MESKRIRTQVLAGLLGGALALLGGCGGGGGGGSSTPASGPGNSGTSATDSGSTTTTGGGSTGGSGSTTTPTPTPAASTVGTAVGPGASAAQGGTAASVVVSNSTPQTNSTSWLAQAAGGPEGFWVSADGSAVVFLDAAANRLLALLPSSAGATATSDFRLIDARFAAPLGGTTWSFDATLDSSRLGVGGRPIDRDLVGSLAFVPGASATLKYTPEGSAERTQALTYANANAWARTVADAQGTWKGSTTQFEITVAAADGNGVSAITGRTVTGSQFGVCTLAGDLRQVASGASKNLFLVTLRAAGGSACAMSQPTATQDVAYSGYAAINYTSAFTSTAASAASNTYMLTLLLRTPNLGWITGNLVQQ